MEKLSITNKAKELLETLKKQYGPLIFHQSGGCCDGSAPICLPKGELLLDDNDQKIGEIEDCSYYMSKDQYQYWQHSAIKVDIVEGRGSSFSVEIPHGYRFIIESRLLQS